MLLNSDQASVFLTGGKKQQVGIDLTVKNIRKIEGGSITIDYGTKPNPYTEVERGNLDSVFVLPRGIYSLEFDQGVKLDNKHAGLIIHRSSINKVGAKILSGIYEPGFWCDTIGATLHVIDKPVYIERGARIAQFIS